MRQWSTIYATQAGQRRRRCSPARFGGLVTARTWGSRRTSPKRIKAGDLIREVAQVVGGRQGRRRPDFAQGGGDDASKLDQAFERLDELVEADPREHNVGSTIAPRPKVPSVPCASGGSPERSASATVPVGGDQPDPRPVHDDHGHAGHGGDVGPGRAAGRGVGCEIVRITAPSITRRRESRVDIKRSELVCTGGFDVPSRRRHPLHTRTPP